MKLCKDSERLVAQQECPVHSQRYHPGGTILVVGEKDFPLRLQNKYLLVMDNLSFLNAICIESQLEIEATSQITEFAEQVVYAAAQKGFTLVSEPNVTYYDTFPFLMTMVFEARVTDAEKPLRFVVLFNIELEI